jgi:hypothetical protein
MRTIEPQRETNNPQLPPTMKTPAIHGAAISRHTNRRRSTQGRTVFSLRLSETSIACLCFLLGSLGGPPAGAAQAGPRDAGPLRQDVDPIVVAAPGQPARFSFDRAQGKVEYAGEAAGEAARKFLNPSPDEHPVWQYVALTVGAAAAPFAAAQGAIRAGQNKLSPVELSQSESNLVQAMAQMAEQRHLRGQFLKIAGEQPGRRFIPGESLAAHPEKSNPAGAVLALQVEELRLERMGSSDASFVLAVKARALILQAGDGAVLCDESFQHRSGQGLFYDWTLHGVLQSMAETAYRHLALEIFGQLFATPGNTTVLVGAGYRKLPPHQPGFAKLRPSQPSQTPPAARAQFVDDSYSAWGPVAIFSTSALSRVMIQKPLTKREALAEAVRETDDALGGLQDALSPAVSGPACFAAIPIGLWKQTAGAIGGLTSKQFQAADAQLSNAVQLSRADERLARQIAFHLAPRVSQPVMLVNAPFAGESLSATGGTQSAAGLMLVRGGAAASTTDDGSVQRPNTILDIRLVSAELKGKESVNPHLALCVEAQVTVWRVSDGRALCSMPVHYRSAERKFVKWAAHDARLFREELERCLGELGRGTVDQLVSQGLVAPSRLPASNLAANPR